jgi:hypothetical protein
MIAAALGALILLSSLEAKKSCLTETGEATQIGARAYQQVNWLCDTLIENRHVSYDPLHANETRNLIKGLCPRSKEGGISKYSSSNGTDGNIIYRGNLHWRRGETETGIQLYYYSQFHLHSASYGLSSVYNIKSNSEFPCIFQLNFGCGRFRNGKEGAYLSPANIIGLQGGSGSVFSGISSSASDSERPLCITGLTAETVPCDNPRAEGGGGQDDRSDVKPKRIIRDPLVGIGPTIFGILLGLLLLSLIGVIPHETEREKRQRRKCNAAKNKIAPSPPDPD